MFDICGTIDSATSGEISKPTSSAVNKTSTHILYLLKYIPQILQNIADKKWTKIIKSMMWENVRDFHLNKPKIYNGLQNDT